MCLKTCYSEEKNCDAKEEIKLLTYKVYHLENIIQNMVKLMKSLEKEINKIKKGKLGVILVKMLNTKRMSVKLL